MMCKWYTNRQVYSTTVLLFLPILTANPHCTEYGICKQYVPAPPGQTPTCAKYGSTFCEHIDHYPKFLIKYLIERWGYDFYTLLKNESKDDFIQRKGSPYGPKPFEAYYFNQLHYGHPSSVIQPSISYGPLTINISHQPLQDGYPDRRYKINPHLLTNALQQPPGYNPQGLIPPLQQSNLESLHWWTRYRSSSRRKRQTPPGSSIQLCATQSNFIMPKAALNTRGSWKYTVNLNEIDDRYTQLVRSETCVSSHCNGLCSLPNGYTSRCEQKFVQKRLVALEDDGKNLYSDVFWFPHCCVCEIVPIT